MRRRASGRFSAIAVGLAACLAMLAFGEARAVVIDSGDGTGNTTAPEDFRWWSHVDQRLGGTSLIHLGDGWVLTTRHVGMGSLMFGEERYEPDPRTAVELGEPGKPADLILFRMTRAKPWPVLEPMEIAATPPKIGEDVLMIGNGHNRGPQLRSTAGGLDVPIGWSWGAESSIRWGTNRVDVLDETVNQGDMTTRAFATRFDSLFRGGASVHEAQAATGDSGGAVFKRRVPGVAESDWVLAGMIFTVSHPRCDSIDATHYGDYTHSVDLASYREQLLAFMGAPVLEGRVDPRRVGAAQQTAADEPADATAIARHGFFWVASALGLSVIAYLFIRVSRTRR